MLRVRHGGSNALPGSIEHIGENPGEVGVVQVELGDDWPPGLNVALRPRTVCAKPDNFSANAVPASLEDMASPESEIRRVLGSLLLLLL